MAVSVQCVLCDKGPMKAVARKPKPLRNLHSVVQLEKQLLKQLANELRSEVLLTMY